MACKKNFSNYNVDIYYKRLNGAKRRLIAELFPRATERGTGNNCAKRTSITINICIYYLILYIWIKKYMYTNIS